MLKSAIGASDEGMISDRIHAEAEVILEQHKFNSLKMWKFCGVAVVRLARQGYECAFQRGSRVAEAPFQDRSHCRE